MACITFVATVLVIRKSHPKERRIATKVASLQGISPRRTLLSRAYLGNTMAYGFGFGFGFAVMMTYISASPFVYEEMIGLTPVEYGVVFGVNALGSSW